MSDFNSLRVPGLDLVRSAAILCVLAGHYWPIYDRFPAAAPLKFLGVIGVELFFVLSGFLIGGILLRQAFKLHEGNLGFSFRDCPSFWVRRWFRTLPNYLLFFILFLLFDQPWVSGNWRPWFLSAFFLQNLFIDSSDGTFGIAWSLCVEEWLYLIMPLLLAVFSLRATRPGKPALFSALLLIVIPTLLRFGTKGNTWDIGVRHVVIYRLDAIAYGVLLAYASRYRRGLFDRLASAPAALGGFAVLGLIWLQWLAVGHHWIEPGHAGKGLTWIYTNVVFFSAVSLAIVPIVAWGSQIGELPPGFKTLVYRTSIYSYSMYLGHELVFYYCSPAIYSGVSRVFGEFHGLTFIVAALVLVAVYGFSAAIYHLWEARMTRLREHYSPSRLSVSVTESAPLVLPSA